MELAKQEQALSLFTTQFWRLDEETGKPLVVQAQEGAQADRECGASSVLLAASEPAAYTRISTSGWSHGPRVPGTTE